MSESFLTTDKTMDFTEVENIVIDNLRKILKPIIQNFELKTEKYRALSVAIKELPEFQKIISENADLKNKLFKMKQETEIQRVGLKITEKNNIENMDDPVMVGYSNHESRLQEAIENDNVFSVSDEETTTTESSNIVKKELQSEIDKIKMAEVGEDEEQEEDEDEEQVEEVEEDEEQEEDEDEEQVEEVEEQDEEQVEEVEEEEDEEQVEEVEEDEEQEEDEDEEQVEDDEEQEEDEDEEKVEDDEEEEEEGEDDEEEENKNGEKVDKTCSSLNESDASGENSEEDDEEQDDEEEEVFMIEIEAVNYYTNDDNNGDIYKILDDEDIGEKVGYFKDGEPYM